MNQLPDSNLDALASALGVDTSRREFVKTSSFAAAMTMLGGIPLFAQDKPAVAAADPGAPTVKCAVIGCNVWGRELLATLARLPKAEVIAVCDHYETDSFKERMKGAAPKAELYTDYKKVLENKNVQAVIVATPTHLHKEIAIAALQAGKHVYCEAPLANTIEDARAIAQAARDSVKSYFQPGLGLRSDPQRKFLLPFVRIGATGSNVKSRAQWHKKTSWRRSAATPERETELNWRLDKEISPGLIGEIGVQQIDEMQWFLNKRPVSVTGFGGILFWQQDGRTVEDTAQAVFQYADGTSFNYEACIATSFDSDYEILYGSDAAIMLRGNKAWLFKEADAALLGWEVYARKEQFFKETGIALVADASKSGKQGKGDDDGGGDPAHYFGLKSFLDNSEMITNGIEDFNSTYDAKDMKALREYLAALQKSSRQPAATWQDGYESTVCALKANEAVMKKTTIKFEKEWFEV